MNMYARRYLYTMRVEDSEGASDSTTCELIVLPDPIDEFAVELHLATNIANFTQGAKVC